MANTPQKEQHTVCKNLVHKKSTKMAILHYSIYMSWISHNHKIRNILIDISSGTDNPKVLPNNILALHLQVVASSDVFPHSTVVFVTLVVKVIKQTQVHQV